MSLGSGTWGSDPYQMCPYRPVLPSGNLQKKRLEIYNGIKTYFHRSLIFWCPLNNIPSSLQFLVKDSSIVVSLLSDSIALEHCSIQIQSDNWQVLSPNVRYWERIDGICLIAWKSWFCSNCKQSRFLQVPSWCPILRAVSGLITRRPKGSSLKVSARIRNPRYGYKSLRCSRSLLAEQLWSFQDWRFGIVSIAPWRDSSGRCWFCGSINFQGDDMFISIRNWTQSVVSSGE